MKKFIFDSYKSCINPNRLEIGDERFWIEIHTAEKDGKWYHGYVHWKKGDASIFGNRPSFNTYSCNSEEEAIMEEAKHIIDFLEWCSKREDYEIPESVTNKLKELSGQLPKQLSLF